MKDLIKAVDVYDLMKKLSRLFIQSVRYMQYSLKMFRKRVTYAGFIVVKELDNLKY